jgi:hypothetical protein
MRNPRATGPRLMAGPKKPLSELAAKYRASAAEMRRSANLIRRINLRSEIFRVADQLDQLAERLEQAAPEAMKGEER